MPLEANPLWVRYREDPRPSAVRGFEEELLRGLSAGDVDELAAMCRKDEPEKDVDAALRLLMGLARRKDGRLNPHLGDWIVSVRRLARRLYPRHRTGCAAFQAWRDHARSEAEMFAAAELSIDDLRGNEQALMQLVFDLGSLAAYGSSAALKRLQELKDLPENVRARRDAALRLARPATRQEVEAMAEEYRRNQSPEALHRIYYRYIGGLPPRTVKVADLVRLLGEPDQELPNSVSYQPNEGTSLYLEADADGFLSGSKLV